LSKTLGKKKPRNGYDPSPI